MTAETNEKSHLSPSPSTSTDTAIQSIFSEDLTSLDAPESPLSDYPDDLSDCSEGRADGLVKRNAEDYGVRSAEAPNTTLERVECSPQLPVNEIPSPSPDVANTGIRNDMQGAEMVPTAEVPAGPSHQIQHLQTNLRSLYTFYNLRRRTTDNRAATAPDEQTTAQGRQGKKKPESNASIPKKRRRSAPTATSKKKRRTADLHESQKPDPPATADNDSGRPIKIKLRIVKEDSSTKAKPKDKPSLIVKLKCRFPQPPQEHAGGLSQPESQEDGAPHPQSPPDKRVRLEETPLPEDSVDTIDEAHSIADTDNEISKLENLSRALFSLSHRAEKPNAIGKPEVWADSRQELCETLPYYRGYQSAAYMSGGFAHGFMFDKSAFFRDYTDSNVVICRAAGGMIKNKETGNMVLGNDQTEGSGANSLRNNMANYNPVVLITGADNPTLPCKPPHIYNVLDYFKPTHIWHEKSKGKTVIRYRFEKLNLDKPSWWKVDEEPVALGALPAPVLKDCAICKAPSPQVYLQGWMCLQPSCRAHWKLAGGAEPNEDELLYDPRFLKQRTAWPNENEEYPLTPADVMLSSHALPGEDRLRACWAGIVCPECGRCTTRLAWLAWECPCGFKKEPPQMLLPATTLRDPFFTLSHAYTASRDIRAPAVKLEVSFQDRYRINKYILPGIDGFVAHLVANKPIVEEAGGPDEMFEELQTHDIGLRRRPMENGQLKGGSFTRHFLVNYGMPYKFIAATASRSFDGAARPITSTRSRLNWASKLMVGNQHREFNEVLALGYFEQQKIGYHDDGEYGLGPTITTLSLGATGTMRLRMKATHHHGVSASGVFNETVPKPGCEKYAERLAALPELEALKGSADYRVRLKTLPKELGLRRSGTARDALTMTLGHGDIVIMHGADIQRYYEHSVDHGGNLRFALTCRYIDPESLQPADRPTYEVGPDTGVYDGSKV